jgi:hypothetical protein
LTRKVLASAAPVLATATVNLSAPIKAAYGNVTINVIAVARD